MKLFYKIIPWLVIAVFAAEVVAVFMPKRDGQFHVREFGRLPVLMNGRIQPFDSVGRNTLLQIRSTGDLPLEQVPSWKFWHHPKKLKSTEWLLELMFKPEIADTRPVFVIHHPELLAELNLTGKGVEKSGLNYFTFAQLQPVLAEIEKQGAQARQTDAKLRTHVQKQVIKLHNAVFIYQMMKAAGRPPTWTDFQKQLAELEKVTPAGVEALKARDAGQKYDEAALAAFWKPVQEIFSLSQDSNAGQVYPLVIPPFTKEQKHEDWTSVAQALMESVRNRAVSQPLRDFAAMASSYGQDRPDAFNAAVSRYRAWLQTDFSRELKKGRNEFFFNDTKAFLHSMIMYVCAFLLAAFSLLLVSAAPRLGEALRKSALYLVILAFGLHTFGLVFRMYLEARPPVTNLYSSAVFIGWGTVILGLGLERVFKVGIGSLVASLVAFITLIIAQNLALGGDTMEMMRAVLDTNFWLATHVVTITLGYAATFAAGFLAIIYVLVGVFTPVLRQRLGPAGVLASDENGGGATVGGNAQSDLGKAISKMVYAIICFATLFSFAGTVLGGIWADQSWGRFWGWDPKENGALLIVLWCAVVLHARWGGLVRDRGLMNLAIFGNIVTAFSWFGVNMLGVGLHSYGFMDSASNWLMIFYASQVAVIALGLVPLNYWRSFRASPPASSQGGTPTGKAQVAAT